MEKYIHTTQISHSTIFSFPPQVFHHFYFGGENQKLKTQKKRITLMSEQKKVVVIGHSGTIGSHVCKLLEKYNKDNGLTFHVIKAGRRGPYELNLEKSESIRSFLEKVKDLDAVISCAGSQYWGPLENLDRKNLEIGFRNKLGGNSNIHERRCFSLFSQNASDVVFLKKQKKQGPFKTQDKSTWQFNR